MVRNLKNFSFIFSLIAYIYIYFTVVLQKSLENSEVITASFLMIITFLSFYAYGYRKDKINIKKKNIVTVSLISLILYFVLIYVLGLLTGFLRNSYSLTLSAIVKNTLPMVLIITSMELFRYNILEANRDKKYITILIIMLFTAIDVMFSIKAYNLIKVDEAFVFFATSLLPAVIKNSVLCYVTKNTGYKLSIVYRLVTEIYIYVAPIIPDIGDYLTSVLTSCFPLFLYIYISRIVQDYDEGEEIIVVRKAYKAYDFPVIATCIILFILISRIFPVFMIGIGSSSMSPVIKKGDVVIAVKPSSIDKIKKSDIIVYKNNKKSIIHRVVEIHKENGIYVKTKGDANNTVDSKNIKEEDIEGVVKYKIPYLAYPTIYVTEFLKKGGWLNE